jgi:predicted enzyme related to lactoylglutathione lyase
MTVINVRAAIAVADLEAALAWYERMFGRPADSRPMDSLAEWNVTESGGIQLVRDADHAGKSLTTLIVDDLEKQVADLRSRNLDGGAITTGDVARFAVISDPEGNTITFAEPIGES